MNAMSCPFAAIFKLILKVLQHVNVKETYGSIQNNYYKPIKYCYTFFYQKQT